MKNYKNILSHLSLIYPLKISIVTLIIFILVSCSEKQEQKMQLLPVQVSKPIKKKITQWDEFTGRFDATNRVEVRARVSGFIDKVNFIDGQLVKKGDILFIIDQRPFTIALKEAKAAYKQSIAEYKQAEENFKRVETLKESGAVSIEEYDRRQQVMVGALARSEVAQAAIDQANLNLQFTTVQAPISGRVSRDLVNPGNLINGGTGNATLLTTIVSLDPIHFYFEGSEADFLKYAKLNREGKRGGSRNTANPIEVRLLNEEEFIHKGKMDFVDNEISRNTGTIQGRAIFDNKDHTLEPGMFGRARLLGSGEYEAILLPDELIGTNQTVKFVYTIDKDSTVKAVSVSLGELYEKKYRIITSGLTGEEKILINNIQKVQPGVKISPEEKELNFINTQNK